jgi:hypothetical protein
MNPTFPRPASVVPPYKTIKKLLGAALVSAVAAAPAHAGPIDFEGFAGSIGGTEYIQQGGFDIGFYANVADGGLGSLVGNFYDGTDPSACIGMACPVNNPGTYYGALNDSYVDITASASGSLFKVKSFDASFIGSSPVLSSYPAISGLLRLQGVFADDTAMTEDFFLGGPGAGGFQFAHFNTTAAFGDMEFKELALFGFVCNSGGTCSAFQTDRAQFGIDNIDLMTVPEPSSYLLLGMGMLAMGAAVSRRNSL